MSRTKHAAVSLWKSTMCIDSRAWITSYRDTCAWLGKYSVN